MILMAHILWRPLIEAYLHHCANLLWSYWGMLV